MTDIKQNPSNKINPALRKIRDKSSWKDFFSDLLGDLRKKFDNLPQTNFEQAGEFLEDGRYNDAIFRLRVALWLSDNFPKAWYMLGSCYYSIGNKPKAMAAMKKAFSQAPNDEDILFMIATIDESELPPEKRPDAMPLKLVKSYFTTLAPDFDEIQKQEEYRGHIFVDQAVRSVLDSRRTNYEMLDIGCGTGAVADLLADFVTLIIGVDCTKEMLIKASVRMNKDDTRRVYSKTIQEDLRVFLKAQKAESFDIITAAHVLNFMGDLDEVVGDSAKILTKGGIFVLQTAIKFGEGYGMPPGTGHFAHSNDYVKGLAEKHGLKILRREEVMVYPHRRMNQYVLQKPTGLEDDD